MTTDRSPKECIKVTGYKGAAKYFKCEKPLAGLSVHLKMTDRDETLKLCEVEIFQTSTSK